MKINFADNELKNFDEKRSKYSSKIKQLKRNSVEKNN